MSRFGGLRITPIPLTQGVALLSPVSPPPPQPGEELRVSPLLPIIGIVLPILLAPILVRPPAAPAPPEAVPAPPPPITAPGPAVAQPPAPAPTPAPAQPPGPVAAAPPQITPPVPPAASTRVPPTVTPAAPRAVSPQVLSTTPSPARAAPVSPQAAGATKPVPTAKPPAVLPFGGADLRLWFAGGLLLAGAGIILRWFLVTARSSDS